MKPQETRPVLITEGTSGASRAALSAARLAGAAGYRVIATAPDPALSFVSKSRWVSETFHAPHIKEDPGGYLRALEELQETEDPFAILPLSDVALLALRPELESMVAKGPMSKAAEEVGLLTPPTTIYRGTEALLDSATSFELPVIVKPSVKVTAARVITDLKQLADLPRDKDISWLVQPVLTGQMSGVAGVSWEGRILGAAHLRYRRLWPLPCGTVASAYTAEPDLELEAKLSTLLGTYSGPFHVDMADNRILDLNLRVHATTPVAAAAGTDLVGIYLNALRGKFPDSTSRARPGVLFRWVEADIRSILAAAIKREVGVGETLGLLRPRRNTVHSLWDPGDIKPLLARATQVRKRLGEGKVPV